MAVYNAMSRDQVDCIRWLLQFNPDVEYRESLQKLKDIETSEDLERELTNIKKTLNSLLRIHSFLPPREHLPTYVPFVYSYGGQRRRITIIESRVVDGVEQLVTSHSELPGIDDYETIIGAYTTLNRGIELCQDLVSQISRQVEARLQPIISLERLLTTLPEYIVSEEEKHALIAVLGARQGTIRLTALSKKDASYLLHNIRMMLQSKGVDLTNAQVEKIRIVSKKSSFNWKDDNNTGGVKKGRHWVGEYGANSDANTNLELISWVEKLFG